MKRTLILAAATAAATVVAAAPADAQRWNDRVGAPLAIPGSMAVTPTRSTCRASLANAKSAYVRSISR